MKVDVNLISFGPGASPGALLSCWPLMRWLGAAAMVLLAAGLARAEERTMVTLAALGARLPQARETTAANTVAAAPRPDLIHPGARRYFREINLLP